MNKNEKENRNISFMLFLFLLFSTCFDVMSSSGEMFFYKVLKIDYIRRDSLVV